MDAQTWYRVGSVFDRLAAQYDRLWTSSAVGRLQRQAVWRSMDRFFRSGDKLIDLGCGTGEDALHLARRGMQIFAIDASPEMVRIARGRGVNASVLGIEEVGCIQGLFDGAISNFGALNCVSNLEILRGMLGRLVNPGGYLAVCTLGRF